MRSKRQAIVLCALLAIAAYLCVAFIFMLPPVGCVYIGQSLVNCRYCLKEIESGKATLEMDKHWEAGHEVREADLKEALGFVPRCPGGGSYIFNNIGKPATCSLAGTSGPKPRKKVVGFIFWSWDQQPSVPHEL